MIMNSILEQARRTAFMIIFIINLCNLFGKQNSTFSDQSYTMIIMTLLIMNSSRKHDGEGGRVLFRRAVEERLLPLLTAFKPDLIIMSSGKE